MMVSSKGRSKTAKNIFQILVQFWIILVLIIFDMELISSIALQNAEDESTVRNEDWNLIRINYLHHLVL